MRLTELRNWLGRGRQRMHAAAAGGMPRPEASLPEALALAALPGMAPEPDDYAPPRPGRHALWTSRRVALADELWGEGYLSPGGAAELVRLAVPLGLSAASSLLLLGTEAGGPPRTLANELGVWVAAHEADPDLAALAALRIQQGGTALAKRATVATWNPAAPAFRRHFFHHAIGIEAVRDAVAEPVLSAIAGALKPRGQLVLVETVAPAPLNPADPAVAAWCRLEGRGPALPTEEAITRVLGRLGFEVRVVEDMSARHMKLAVLGWKRLVREMAAERPDRARAATVVGEAELWTRRIRLMHEGRIRLMRWHAILTTGAT